MIKPDWKFTDDRITAEVSPCSYMYAGYGLQLSIRLNQTNQTEYLINKVPFAEATEADAMELIESVQLTACACGNARFDIEAMGMKSNRGEQCEVCFLRDLDARYEKERQKEETKIAKDDAKMKAKGFCFKVCAWIHPKRGGDDYQIDYYFRDRPADVDIEKELGRKSSITNDYTIKEL